jgi:hypothetical protein
MGGYQMSEENKVQSIPDETLRVAAVNEVSKYNNALDNIENFIKKVGKQFIQNKLNAFPRLCVETRRVNYLKQQELNRLGNPKGWSDKKDFKFDYIIPTELYMFMTNLIYRNFWAEDNERVWRSFMKAIMRGDDPLALLGKVKLYYDGTLPSKSKHW